MLSIIGIAAIAVAIFLLGRFFGKRAVYIQLAAVIAEYEETGDEFIDAQRLNALNQ